MDLRQRYGLIIGLLCLCVAGGALAADGVVTVVQSDEGLLGQGLLEVHFINVASADCFLLRMGDQTMLVDSGTRATSDRILTYLESVGVDSLDYAFASHPHDDHVGGFSDVLPVIPVDVFMAPHRYEDDYEKSTVAIRRALREADLPITYVENESSMAFGDATLTFYQWQARGATGNSRSMMMMIRYGERTMLLSADVSSNAQKALAELYGDQLKADILKLPHHGISTYQMDFHKVVQPELATFSNIVMKVEENIDRLEARRVSYLFTTKGNILAVTDGATWQVYQNTNK
ncbi:MAG: MBL fold metallo-hydrolase [Oscillospiraceae bacterium]|jgi:beta-lactamase superfamily II metal-dependent hydrolase|nr:MBL fold metallo-hydrolase [Oscillospiraceae bacterium]